MYKLNKTNFFKSMHERKNQQMKIKHKRASLRKTALRTKKNREAINDAVKRDSKEDG